MTDIVELLRCASVSAHVRPVLRKAADEIEQLREQNARLILEACKYMPKERTQGETI